MLALDDVIDLGDVDILVEAAVNARQVLVDLQDHDIRPFQNRAGNAVAQEKLK